MDFSNFDFGKKLNLTDIEEGFCLEGDEWNHHDSPTDLILVEKILGGKNYNLESVGSILSNAWSPGKGMEVKQIEDGRLIFSFKHKLDKRKALEGGPWSFKKRLVVLNSVLPDANPVNIDLRWCEFYVHIMGLPLAKYNKSMVEKICSKLGKLISIQASSFMMISNDRGDLIVATFKYERLPNFCYRCGLLDHVFGKCPRRYEEDEETSPDELPYGPWLRAPNSGKPQSNSWQSSTGTYVFGNSTSHPAASTFPNHKVIGVYIFSPSKPTGNCRSTSLPSIVR
ncbi:hypothetical protein ACJIZ3_014421 [Penstemon smallii]|uniref:DUF4283 domain-containing protein n=1 Tax=Penstemon smallii TaxID=265156 RepID=A0ABD3RJM1_9LAMI